MPGLTHIFAPPTNPTSPTFDRSKGIFRALPKDTRRGWPNICLIHQGAFYGIEVKVEKGRLSDDQQLLGEEIESNGGHYTLPEKNAIHDAI